MLIVTVIVYPVLVGYRYLYLLGSHAMNITQELDMYCFLWHQFYASVYTVLFYTNFWQMFIYSCQSVHLMFIQVIVKFYVTMAINKMSSTVILSGYYGFLKTEY